MYLRKSISNGREYLSFVQGYRQDGKVKQKTIEKIGYLDDLQKIYDDPIAHFKRVAQERSNTQEVILTINANVRLEDNTDMRKNLGYAVLKHIYNRLEIPSFFQNRQRSLNIEYNLNKIFSLLVYNRFLFPSSKKRAFEKRGIFFETFDFSLDDVYRSLDYLSRYAEPLQKHLYKYVRNFIEVDDQLGYYDVTNYYFEIPYSDEDEWDQDGNVTKKGFRKKGPSKEHRPDPIVQMGLLLDSKGIPLAFNTFEGNESEKTSLLPIIRRVKKDYEMKRIIVVADRGLNTSDNTAYISGESHDDSEGYDGYVYGQSVLASDKEFKTWVLHPSGYISEEEINKDGEKVLFTRKTRVFAKTIRLKDKDGKRTVKMVISQKQLVYYSQKYANKQKKERERVLTKARDMINNPTKYNQSTSYGAAGYVKNIQFIKGTGEIADGLNLSLDLEKIAQEEQFDGYYSIVTSEKNMSDKEMRDTYRGLWEIEESFQIIKHEFKARPVFVKLKDHINAHFLVCFVTLLITRVLEHTTGNLHSIRNIRESLASYSCSLVEQNYHLFDFRNDVLKTMEKTFQLDLGKKYMSTAEIKTILQT